MTTWTESARSTLEGHLTRMRQHLHYSGADPVEVTDDVRRHIDEEVAARKIGVVTTQDVESILRVLGLPEPPLNGRVAGNRIEEEPTLPEVSPNQFSPERRRIEPRVAQGRPSPKWH